MALVALAAMECRGITPAGVTAAVQGFGAGVASDRMIIGWALVREHAGQTGMTLRAAATAIAVSRVAEPHRIRGPHP